MKASLFFKDRAGSLAGLFFVLVLEALFMRVLLVSGPVIGVVTGTTACFFVVDLWIQFFKRRGYYNRLIKNTCQMDQAYLVHETMEKPDFYEGQILYEVLEETDRSMTGYSQSGRETGPGKAENDRCHSPDPGLSGSDSLLCPQ